MANRRLYQIPGYEGLYWIAMNGSVFNQVNHPLKLIKTNNGAAVELRKDGQRETYLVRDLMIRAREENHEDIRDV